MKVVAIKQYDRNGLHGNREFLVEVLMLGLLHHPNIINLNGYCADGDQRLLVYEYMPLGSLEDHLHGKDFVYSPHASYPLFIYFSNRKLFHNLVLQTSHRIRNLLIGAQE